MSNIKGTIVNVKDYLCDEIVNVKIVTGEETAFVLEKGRCYVIPDYQREIRWTSENLMDLMNDISHHSKFLGNIILAKKQGKRYAIIDGQQRTSILCMLVYYVFSHFSDELSESPKLCKTINESFAEYDAFQSCNYSINGLDNEKKRSIIDSDKYGQSDRFEMLWKTIEESGMLSDASKARDFIQNLYRCDLNIILSEDDSTDYSIEYFLDVNLKGIKLDTEDIFKGYLFHLDPTEESREIWVKLKQKAREFNEKCIGNSRAKTDCYPLMKMIEHYTYSYLYKNDKYKEVVFGEDFCLKERVKIDSKTYYVGEHILKVINNNMLVKNLLRGLIDFLGIAIDIVNSGAPSNDFKRLFKDTNGNRIIDDNDISVFHTFMKMILFDRKMIISKALIIKYSVETLQKAGTASKDLYKQLYAIQMYITLFSLFENKKGLEAIEEILKSEDWCNKIFRAICDYCDPNTIESRRRNAEFKYSTNTDNEEQRYRCLSLAAVYNYFELTDNKVRVKAGKTESLRAFLCDKSQFSTEHFIINDSGKVNVEVADKDEYYEYEYEADTKKYATSLFNFIFIPRAINNNLKNKSVRNKISQINDDDVSCEYSRTIIEILKSESALFIMPILSSKEDEENKVIMDKYYSYDFKQQYSAFSAKILSKIADRFTT